MIEAPLSVCFNKKGNPTGRSIEFAEIKGETSRYWHQACGIMVAATYLISRHLEWLSQKSGAII